MRWLLGIGFLTLFGVALGSALRIPLRCEPVYAGKTVDQWLEAGYEDAAMALQQIGPDAAPYILAKVSREDPQHGSLRVYRDVWRKMPSALRKVIPRPGTCNFDEGRACSFLMELGPGIIPLLSTGMRHENPAVRDVSAHALGSLNLRGKDIRPAVPFLVEASRDPVPEVSRRAKWALDCFRVAGRQGIQ
jgi:hypothetical protein